MTAGELGPHVAVVGAGPAGLMAAERVAAGGVEVTVYERMPSAGRKFLLAGRGGLNLTHSEGFDDFLQRYGEAAPHLRPALERFSPDALRAWSLTLGEPTFVGSSGRVFPHSFKASPLLRAWLRRLQEQEQGQEQGRGVRFAMRHAWRGWDDAGALRFDTPDGEVRVAAAATVLALGGASWPRMGSDGAWTTILARDGIAVAPLRPSNAGVLIAWSDGFRQRFEGQPLKNIAVSCGGGGARGDAVVTRAGLEGGAVYAVSRAVREAASHARASLEIALRPDVPHATLAAKLARPRGKQSLSTFLRKALRLSPLDIALMHEAAASAGRRVAGMTPQELARFINALPLVTSGVAPIARAISTAGGVRFAEIDESFMLRRRPGVFVAGEMLDWEAPTGGYLLQASFATGMAAGEGALRFARDGGTTRDRT